MRKRSVILIIVAVAVILFISLIIIMKMSVSETTSARPDRAAVKQGPPLRILHIMSYHMPWKWTEDQLEGFQHSLLGLNVEYKVYQMDTKRHNDPAWLERVGEEASELVRTWQPDLVYTNDDYAQQYVTIRFINSPIPFVFSAVNADPEVYGFVGANNITGVLEQEHFVESVLLLKRLLPKLKKVAVILDDDITWEGVVKRMKEKSGSLSGIEFTSWEVIHTYADFKRRVMKLHGEVDALALLGIFSFKDSNAQNVPYQDVLRWVAENSKLPDFSFWEDRSSYGTLCVVSVSGFEQGLKAGEMARKILVDKVKPGSIPIEPTLKGQPIVSLRRARDLGIQIPADVLLSSVVIETYKWEDEENAP